MKRIPSGQRLFINCLFDKTKNKLDCYKGENCMERFRKDLRKHAMKIVNFDGKDTIPLADKKRKVL